MKIQACYITVTALVFLNSLVNQRLKSVYEMQEQVSATRIDEVKKIKYT